MATATNTSRITPVSYTHLDVYKRQYWHILVKRRRLILSILIAVVAMALLVTLMATPIYRASTVLQIEKQGSQVIQVNGIQPENDMYGWDPDFLQTQIELIKSRSLSERVASDCLLYTSRCV